MPTPAAKRKSSTEAATSPKKQKTLLGFVKKEVVVKSVSTSSTSSSSSSSSSVLFDLLVEQSWRRSLQVEFRKDYFKNIDTFLNQQYSKKLKIFPPKNLIFNAFNLTPMNEIKIVILGQDPYHDNGQAHGLSFSVPIGIDPPPSLKNIYKELATDIENFKAPNHGCLEKWAKEGVLLLNASLTVEAHQANSHSSIGWQTFTDAVIKIINAECDGVVFILWGGFAQKKEKLINVKKHCVIKAAHPSPLSVTKFLGCKCFSKANEALKSRFGKTHVDWHLI